MQHWSQNVHHIQDIHDCSYGIHKLFFFFLHFTPFMHFFFVSRKTWTIKRSGQYSAIKLNLQYLQ